MELRRLEHFLAVAEQRNFTQAARQIHLGQSALSVSVKALERELGAELFVRGRHGVTLTDAGIALLPEARATLAAAEAARDAVSAVRGGVRGALRLGIMQAYNVFDLAGFIARFHSSHPAVDIRLRPTHQGSKALLNDVANGALDLAFASSVGTPPAGVHLRPITSVPLFLAVPETHQLAARSSVPIRELAGHAFVDAPVGWGNRALTDHAFAQAGVERIVSVELGDLFTVTQLVRAGVALAFAPRIPHTDTPSVCLVPCEPPLRLNIHLAVSTRRRPSPATRAFISTVEAEAPPSAAPAQHPHIRP